jgi:hypothetical protein
MSTLVSKLNDNTTTKVLPNHVETKSEGRVIRTNEKENVCDILYENSAGRLERIANVEVELNTGKENWFPKVGDIVKTRETNDNQPIIIGKLIRDYIQDAKINHIYNKDVLPDNKNIVRKKISS